MLALFVPVDPLEVLSRSRNCMFLDVSWYTYIQKQLLSPLLNEPIYAPALTRARAKVLELFRDKMLIVVS